MFYKGYQYHLKNGALYCLKIYLLIALLTGIMCVDFFQIKQEIYCESAKVPSGSVCDYFLFVMGGIKKYIPSNCEKFLLPIRWLLIHMLICYGSISYTMYDVRKVGIYVVERIGNRMKWFVSKIVWNILFVLSCYLLIWGVVFLSVICLEKQFIYSVTWDYFYTIYGISLDNDGDIVNFYYKIMILLPIVSIMLVCIQCNLILYFKYVYSYCAMCSMLLISAYFCSSYLPGNFLMPLRYNEYEIHHYWYVIYIEIVFVIILTSINLYLRLKKMDLIYLEN